MLEMILIVGNVFALGYIIGQSVMAYRVRSTLRKIAEDNGMNFDEMENRFLDNKTKVNVVKVPNMFTELSANSILLYNKDTGNFVAQAETFDELAKNVYKFNNIKFALVKHDDQLYWFVEGKVRTDVNA